MAERDRLMDAIGTRLGLPRVRKGVGSSVHGDFIDPLTLAVGLDPASYRNKYRRIEAVIDRLGGRYDPSLHTSEATPSGGGQTLTNRGLQLILDLLEAGATTGTDRVEDVEHEEPGLDPRGITDARRRGLRAIVARRGQARFRRELLSAYGGRCAITRRDAVPALEAAHIVAYRGPGANVLANGLLLRADVHTLFDLGHLGIDPDAGHQVVIEAGLRHGSYADLAGDTADLPSDPHRRPDDGLLHWHLHRWGDD